MFSTPSQGQGLTLNRVIAIKLLPTQLEIGLYKASMIPIELLISTDLKKFTTCL
jgi:hypothetical protein